MNDSGAKFISILKRCATGKNAYISSLWLYFIAITVAELLTIFIAPWIGLACYVLILILFIVQPSFIEDDNVSNLITGLILIPLIRIISLVIPLIQLPEILWYPLIYLPLLVACISTMRTIKISPRQIGFILKGLPLQIVLGLFLGFMVGILEYAILQVEPMVEHFTISDILLPAVILLVTTGFVEELIFRGIIQKLAIPVMGSITGIIYISLIFAVLHVGFNSITDVAFVFAVSIIFATVVRSTNSLIGVIMAHGTANIVLFLIAPFIFTPGFQLP
jgi:membrane protease YdiL (CAAX protease family)